MQLTHVIVCNFPVFRRNWRIKAGCWKQALLTTTMCFVYLSMYLKPSKKDLQALSSTMEALSTSVLKAQGVAMALNRRSTLRNSHNDFLSSADNFAH